MFDTIRGLGAKETIEGLYTMLDTFIYKTKINYQ
jgi:hypothetical protein